ncbi:ABC transporter permease subunit [Pseudomonas sp. 13.2]|uniref:ABC transporter permease subunit n=1 Tax=Pseudomonas sp. 13.2 TaxID=3144665 RepID=A0AAU7BGZ0_9PSED
MLRYILLRLALLVPVILGASLLVFVLLHLGSTDPALDYLRLSHIPPTDAAIAEVRHTLGLDRPLYAQYLSWLWNAVHLDFGISYITGRPVLDDLLYYLPATLQLGGLALACTLLLSIPLGLLAARWQGRWPDHAVRAVTFLGVSMPNFWLAFLLIALFSLWLGWLPPLGRGGGRAPGDAGAGDRPDVDVDQRPPAACQPAGCRRAAARHLCPCPRPARTACLA